jgi:hypothetical protein
MRLTRRWQTDGPLLDLSIVVIDDDHVPARVVPIAILPAELALTDEDIGGTVTLVGFGAVQPPGSAATGSTRQGGSSTLVAIEAERVTVASSPTQARACFRRLRGAPADLAGWDRVRGRRAIHGRGGLLWRGPLCAR